MCALNLPCPPSQHGFIHRLGATSVARFVDVVAQVALNWVATQPGITSMIVGASRPDQLEENLRFAEFEIPVELRRRLDEVSLPESIHPHVFFEPGMQGAISGATKLNPWTPARLYAPPSGEPAGVTARSVAAAK